VGFSGYTHRFLVSLMLGGIPEAEVPEELMARIRRVHSLSIRAGGELLSRQVIATIVDAWQREQGHGQEE
jgi:hypothetical protein